MEGQQVVERILADARTEAEKIKRASEEKEAVEQARLKEELGEYKKQTEALARKAGEDKKAKLLASARMDIARQFLAEKRVILDEVFSRARAQLQNLSDEDYRRLMSKLMAAAVETGDEEVVIDKAENRIDQGFIDEVNRQLNSNGKGKLKLSSERQNFGFGFILRRGKIKNNVSIEVLMAQVRKGLEIQLAKELFGK